eukprot:TRINITY_DN203093_c0_g1_i3.p1 TRINITY_DN203093_c0_g1~~TRINITY_DN203093_c0_g1_i3.p1  ORF type:complete len:585 (-),score=75.56 TRINITY_DN203093_c0_g1_i3:156-1910(-)
MSDYWSSKTVYAGWSTKTDFNSIIDATVKMEKFRYNQLSKEQAEVNFKKEQIEGLNRTLLTYKKQLGSMDSLDEFLVKKVSSSKSDIATATVKAGAQEGMHSLEVTQLAEVATVTSNDMDAVAYTGADKTISFKYDGTAYPLDVKKDMTTKELANAITSASSGTVKASVVDLGTGKFKLQMRGMELGKDHDFEEFGELKNILAGAGDSATVKNKISKNAKFTLDEIPIERSTNSISDVTEGVTYNLNAAEIGTKITLKVDTDYDTIVANVEKFVQLTNELRTGFDLVKDYENEELDKKGVHYSLKGSSQIKSVEDTLKNVLATQGDGFLQGEGGNNDPYLTLSSIGVKTIARNNDKNMGKLEFDKDAVIIQDGKQTFMDLLKADPEAVASIFAAGGQGVSTDVSVLEFNSSMYDFGYTKAGIYEIEYDGGNLPTTGDKTTITMKINGVDRSVGYTPATGLATIQDDGRGEGKGLAFKVVDTTAGVHSAKLAIKEGKVQATINALNVITEQEKGTFNVLIKKYTEQLKNPYSGLEKKMKDELARVDALEKRLIAQYAKTEKTLSQYKGIQSMLDFQLKSQLADKD